MKAKQCYTCSETKPVSDFWPAGKGKYNSNCKRCANDLRNAWYKTKAGKEHIAKMNLAPARRFLRLKYQAKKRGLSVEFDRHKYEKLVSKACHYCGGSIEDTGWGLDRKDNTKGYSVDNVVPSCKWCNTVKNDRYSYDEMLQLGKTIKEILRVRKLSK